VSAFAGLTLEAARRRLAALLRAEAIESPELDARLLLGKAVGLDLTGLTKQGLRALTPAEATALAALADRRVAHEPVARILGEREFWGLRLQLSAATLVPRPDTETVVEAALDAMSVLPPERIADLGTGSGALVLALASEWREARCFATDLDPDALATATANAERLGLAERIRFLQGHFADPLEGHFDLIVSNPPYIPSGDIPDLAPEVRDHDPRLALDGGSDGLEAYRDLIPAAARKLTDQGVMVLEVGIGQAVPVAGLMRAAGLRTAPPRADLGGVSRAVVGRKSGPQPPGKE
jgi:release factor glutamine methyltransferase